MAALSALFTGGLLWVAWIAYEKLLVQEARKKQLEIVVQLVEKLKNTNLNWTKIVMENGEPKFSLLAMRSIFSMQLEQRPEKNYRMFVPSGNSSFIWLEDYSHPLMPIELVNAWKAFVGSVGPRIYFNSSQVPKEFYCVLSNPGKLSNETLSSHFEINSGTNEFFEKMADVRNSIIKWFSKHGIENVNTGVIW